MPSAIQDEFTKQPMSRQKRYRLRHRKTGKCSWCSRPAPDGALCAICARKALKRNRACRKSKAWAETGIGRPPKSVK